VGRAHDPRILVLRGGAIGDFVLTLPALQALRSRWPLAHIELVGYPHIAALAVEGGIADKVVPLDRSDMARFFAVDAPIPEEQCRYVRSFDLAISYLYDPDETVRRNFLAAGIRQVLYCSPRVTSGHAADHLMKPLESLAIYPDGPVKPGIALRQATVEEGRSVLRRFGDRVIVLHPGSGGKAKRWPLERFISLAGVLRRDHGSAVVFAVGEADDDIAAILRGAGEGGRMLGGLSLVSLAGVLRCAAAYVGNDSGVTHLAAAVGAGVVALFGATDPAVWGPRGANVRIVRGESGGVPDVAAIGVGEVLSALSAVRSTS
jgi:ADP-heptose:LPS heptosyltransferase